MWLTVWPLAVSPSPNCQAKLMASPSGSVAVAAKVTLVTDATGTEAGVIVTLAEGGRFATDGDVGAVTVPLPLPQLTAKSPSTDIHDFSGLIISSEVR
jgi:hypothetical protein